MVTKAQSRGANHIDLFSNSPMWWMCINHNPSGNDVKGANNLAPAYYDTHAVYLASIALEAKNSWGVTFASVEAFNEPSASYWVGNTSNQEGCHFDHASQQSVAIYLRKELNSRGLSSIIVSASDETSYDSATSTWNSFNSTVKASIGRVNVHGYQYEGGNRAALYTAVSGSGKKLWNTEYGEDDGTGKRMVTNLMLDLTELHPTAWVCWQALDRVGWGLIAADVQAGTVGAVSRKYYVLAQFTRHIREGMTILSGGSSYTIAAYDSTNSKLVIVAVNWGASQSITFDLSKFKQGGVSGALVKRWATQIGTSGIQYVAYSDTYLSGTKFSSTFAADELMTFEVSNVTL
jgi:galactan endo-1,6-beta-galactosidase